MGRRVFSDESDRIRAATLKKEGMDPFVEPKHPDHCLVNDQGVYSFCVGSDTYGEKEMTNMSDKIIEKLVEDLTVLIKADIEEEKQKMFEPEFLETIKIHGPDIPEKSPVQNDKDFMWDIVVHDIEQRDAMGTKKYGTRLQPFNGRDPLWDAYQEALDLVVYLRQAIFEKENLEKENKND